MVVFALIAGSNAPAETAARSGEIVSVCGVLSRADFSGQEGAVGLDIAVELASPIGPGWQKLLGRLKEAVLPAQLPADTVLIRLPIPLAIRWDTSLVSGVGTSIGCPPIRAYDAGAIPTHALSQQRLPEGRKAQPEEQQFVTLNAEESTRGNRVSFSGG